MRVAANEPGAGSRKARVWLDGEEITNSAFEADDTAGYAKVLCGQPGAREFVTMEGKQVYKKEIKRGKIKIEIRDSNGNVTYTTA